MAVDPSDVTKVYVGGLCLIASTDGGTSWFAIAQGQADGPHHDHHGLAFDASSPSKVLNANDGGIWRLEDLDLQTWTNVNGNLQITQFVGLALHPTNPDIVYGGTQDTGVMRFNDNLQWTRLRRGDGGAMAVNDFDPRRVYAMRPLNRTDPNFFIRSSNSGDTWVITTPPLMTGINTDDPRNFYPPLVLQSNTNRARDRLLLGTSVRDGYRRGAQPAFPRRQRLAGHQPAFHQWLDRE